MSADTQETPEEDTSERDGIRASIFLLTVIVVLAIATYFFGFGILLGASVIGSFVMIGILIYLSSPRQRI